jgi:hypothetical protein
VLRFRLMVKRGPVYGLKHQKEKHSVDHFAGLDVSVKENARGIAQMMRVGLFKHHTAEALPELLRQLKAGGYKVVHMVPKGEVTTVPKYDEMLAHEDKLSSNNTRPESSVIRTIGE